MSNIIIPKGWHIPEREITPEELYMGRRRFMRTLGLGALAIGTMACRSTEESKDAGHSPVPMPPSPNGDLYPAARNQKYTTDRKLTGESVAASYNNFYEFSEEKERVKDLTGDFQIRPWELEITGLVAKPVKLTVDELVRRLPLEERVYRFRCVEAWAMTVPWTGIPLKKVLDLAEPLSSARYVRFTSFFRPDQAPNQAHATWYKWPYYEALRMDEATNELAMAVTGIYGHELPKQHGAPIRIIVPWKYGYKGPKSIMTMELVEKQPPTFWNDLEPDEYSFLSNVDPAVPHPRWSQATERLIGVDERVPTRPFNGYGEYVAAMYT